MNKLLIAFVFALVLALPLAAGAEDPEFAFQDTPMHDLSTGHTLYVVGYAHLDTQWRWAYPQVIREFIYNTMVDNFALFEQYPEYIFNFSGSRRYEMMKEYYPAEYEKLKEYVEQGRWFPCGSSVDECDVNVPSAESLIRQVLYGNRYFREEFGKTSGEFILPDCFGFPASMPGVLSHCGIRGFSTQKLTWGSAVGIPFNVGIWEGLDGSSVLIAAFNPGAYVGEVKEDLSNSEEWLNRIEENGKASGVYADYHYFGTGDTGGGPTPGSVEWIEKSLSGGGPVKVVSSTAEQMFYDIRDMDIPNLPHYRGDLLLTQHSAGSITSQAYMKRWNRKNELLASSAETASVAANVLAGYPYHKQKLENAWKLTLGGQMHDILPGTSIPQAYDYSWNDEVLAMNQFADVLENASAAVAGTLDTDVEGTPLVIYNPLSIEREDLVVGTIYNYIAGRDFLYDPEANYVRVLDPDGNEVTAQLLSNAGNSLTALFPARVPACGYAVYELQGVRVSEFPQSELTVTERSLENARYRVTVNDDGDVASIFDKQVGRELLSAPLRLAFTHDNPGYWPAWNIDWDDQSQPPYAYVGGPAKITVQEQGPVRVSLRIEREAEGSQFTQIVSLSTGETGNRVEFSNIIDWRSQNCNLKAVFPLTASNELATYNWEAGTIQRPTNNEKQYEVPSHQWFDLTDESGEFGATVLCPFKYGSDKPDASTLRLTLLRTPGVFSDDYADQASQDWGRHQISFGLAGHSGDWRQGRTDWQGYAMEQPMVAFNSGKHAGSARQLSLATVDSPGVRVLALKQAEDSDELIIRLVELDGEAKQGVRVRFAQPVAAAREVNGQEYEVGGATIAGGELECDMASYQLRSFAVTLADRAEPRPVASAPVALPYDTAAATFDGEAARGGFDPRGRSLAAEMLPGELEDAGVLFEMAPGGGGALNAVTCNGQEIALPEGDYNRLYFIMAASPGDQQAEFSVDGRAVELSVQDWGGFIGQWDNRVWRGDMPELAFRWPFEIDHLAPGYIKRDHVAWYSSHRHTPNGRNDVYEYTYLYRYGISIAPGARTLTLPVNNLIKVLAVSAAKIEDPSFAAGHVLYDRLNGGENITDLPEVVHLPKPEK